MTDLHRGVLECFAAVAHPPVPRGRLRCGDAHETRTWTVWKQGCYTRRAWRLVKRTRRPAPVIQPLPRVMCRCGATFGTERARDLHATLKGCT